MAADAAILLYVLSFNPNLLANREEYMDIGIFG